MSEYIAARLGAEAMHTDDVIGDWSERSEIIATRWLTLPGPWVIEGVAVLRTRSASRATS